MQLGPHGAPAIIRGVTTREQDVLAPSADPAGLQYEDEHALKILETVLEVALTDDRLTPDEFALIQRLRKKLRVRGSSKRILLARIGTSRGPGTRSTVRNALNDLQRRGVVFYCNRLDGGWYLIPTRRCPA